MASLIDYLVRMGRDPQEIKKFRADPETAMTDAQLSEQQKSALRSGNPIAIHAEIHKEFHSDASSIMDVSVTTHTHTP